MSGQSLASDSRGRTTIATRALTRVASAVAADELAVDARRVGVALGDVRGELELRITAPITIPPLTTVFRDAGTVERAGGTVLARAAGAREGIRDRTAALTGYHIARVDVRLTAADIRSTKRVS